MNSSKPLALLGRKLWCLLMNHRMYVWQEFSPHSRRVVCDHCGGDWGMHDEARAIIPWDKDLERMYRLFGHKIRERVWTL